MKNALLLLFLALPVLSSATATWVGPTTMNAAAYNTASNWSPTGVPSASENLIFATTVAITANVGIGSGNSLTIQGTGSLTINAGVSITTGDVTMNGVSGTMVNNGTLNAHNLTYGTTAGAVITNGGTMVLNNLNVGNGTNSGAFTNNGSLSLAINIVVEEGTFDNNPGGTVNSNGLDVRSGGIVLNGGSFTSAGATSTAQVTVNSGGKFKNEVGSQLNIDISVGNVFALDVADSFDNKGSIYIGNNPYNANASGVIVRTSGRFVNTAAMIFQIDPAKCVFTDNHGAGGSFFSIPVAIISGSNCGFSVVLPTTLYSFSGSCDGGQAALHWAANPEQPVAQYTITAATEGTDYRKLASVQANSTGEYNLSVTPLSASAYYRLEMVDMAGKTNYSNVVHLACEKLAGEAALIVYPNVLHGENSIQVAYTSTEASDARMVISNMNGALIFATSTTVAAGKNVFSLPVSGLTQGVYFISVNATGAASERKMFVVQ